MFDFALCLIFLLYRLIPLIGGKELRPVTDDQATKFLQQFGYVDPGGLSSLPKGMSGDLNNDPVKAAVIKFQKFSGLPVTGEMDLGTKTKMAQPRCGLQDIANIGGDLKWKKKQLRYKIVNFSSHLSEQRQRTAILRAFSLWVQVVPLEIKEVESDSEEADINVQFGRRAHDDPWPFDGKGGVLAHATFPEDGRLHFDEDEDWVEGEEDMAKIASQDYTDLHAVAVHESGHSLGLQHSEDLDAIMYPTYQPTVVKGNYVRPRLRPNDINAIQKIYGKRDEGWAGDASSVSDDPKCFDEDPYCSRYMVTVKLPKCADQTRMAENMRKNCKKACGLC